MPARRLDAALIPPVTLAELPRLAGDVTDRFRDAAIAWWGEGLRRPAIVAFDVGRVGGYAVVDQHAGAARLVSCGPIVDLQELGIAWCREVARVISTVPRDNGALVVIEDTFVGSRRKPKDGEQRGLGDVATAARLSRRVGAIAALATWYGLPSRRVLSAQWAPKMIGSIPKAMKDTASSRPNRAAGKALSYALACKLYPTALVTSDHIADAILLARFVHSGPVHVATAAPRRKTT